MSPDLVLLNADVRTMFAREHEATALAITRGRISHVGSTSQIGQLATAKTALIDAGGRTVLPGFTDAHCHWGLAAKTLALASYVGTPPVKSIDELILLGRSIAAGKRPGEWVMLQGSTFQDRQIADRRFPTSAELDAVSTKHPVMYRAALHTLVLNRKALEVSGLTPESQVPPGAELERDPSSGELTGVLKEMFGHIPTPQVSGAAMNASLRRFAEEHLLANGVTSLHEIWDDRDTLGAQLDLIRNGAVPLRLNAYGWVPLAGDIEEICDLVAEEEQDPDWYDLAGVKLFADGGTSSKTAALHEDYCDQPDHRGDLTYSDEDLLNLMRAADDAGLQILIHAAGDRALDQVLDAFCNLPERSRRGRPHRVEHGGNHSWSEKRCQTARQAGVLPVPNVGFIFNYGEYWPTVLGALRTERMVPLRTMFEQGFKVPGTSDTTGGALVTMSPIHNIYRATTRLGFAGDAISPEEAISLEDGLKMYTYNGAYAGGRLAQGGAIEVGKFADLLVLSENLKHVDHYQLDHVTVNLTLVDGRVVFER